MTAGPVFSAEQLRQAQRRAIEHTENLIRMHTVNTGNPETTDSTEEAAEYVAGALRGAGLSPEYIDTGEKRRESQYRNVVCTWPGEVGIPEQPGMIWHGHLDVVPPGDEKQWKHKPFDAHTEDDGYIYGRGAVDMKNMDAMMLAVIEMYADAGVKPPRDVMLCFFADEEAGGLRGARRLVERNRTLFDGYDVVIGGEVGGFSFQPERLNQPIFTISTEERGMWWTKTEFTGVQQHGSKSTPKRQHALKKLAAFVSGSGELESRTVELSDPGAQSLNALATAMGAQFNPDNPEQFIAEHLGSFAEWTRDSLKDTLNPNDLVLPEGSKVNTTPRYATLQSDLRFQPGTQMLQGFRDLAQQHDGEVNDITPVLSPWASSTDRSEVRAMHAAALKHSPDALVALTRTAAGTDGKAFQNLLGRPIDTYGFGPLPIPRGEEFDRRFHAVNERVHHTSIVEGVGILADFILYSAEEQPQQRANTSPLVHAGNLPAEVLRSAQNRQALPPGTVLQLH